MPSPAIFVRLCFLSRQGTSGHRVGLHLDRLDSAYSMARRDRARNNIPIPDPTTSTIIPAFRLVLDCRVASDEVGWLTRTAAVLSRGDVNGAREGTGSDGTSAPVRSRNGSIGDTVRQQTVQTVEGQVVRVVDTKRFKRPARSSPTDTKRFNRLIRSWLSHTKRFKRCCRGPPSVGAWGTGEVERGVRPEV